MQSCPTMRSMSTATEQTWTKSGTVTLAHVTLTQKLQPSTIFLVSAQYKPPYTRVNPDIAGVVMV